MLEMPQTTDKRPRGEAHPAAKLTATQVARAKRLLAEAPRVEALAAGTYDRIAAETGITRRTLRKIHYQEVWASVPAEAINEENDQ